MLRAGCADPKVVRNARKLAVQTAELEASANDGATDARVKRFLRAGARREVMVMVVVVVEEEEERKENEGE